jgi:hypothetical protein
MASPDGSGIDGVGCKTVFHATNYQAAISILRSRQMLPGRRGLYGGGIYFAGDPKIALHKQAQDGIKVGVAILLTVLVDFGDALVIEGKASDMTAEQLNSRGCQSVKGRKHPAAGWEFVVYDSSRIIELVDYKIANPDAQKYTAEDGTLRSELHTIRASRPFSLGERIAGIQISAPDNVKISIDTEPGRPWDFRCVIRARSGPLTIANNTGADLAIDSPLIFGRRPADPEAGSAGTRASDGDREVESGRETERPTSE